MSDRNQITEKEVHSERRFIREPVTSLERMAGGIPNGTVAVGGQGLAVRFTARQPCRLTRGRLESNTRIAHA